MSVTISVALNCGLCFGELIALKWDDIDIVAEKIYMQRSDWQRQLGLTKSCESQSGSSELRGVVGISKASPRLRHQECTRQSDGRAGSSRLIADGSCLILVQKHIGTNGKSHIVLTSAVTVKPTQLLPFNHGKRSIQRI